MFLPIPLLSDFFSSAIIKSLWYDLASQHNLAIGKRYIFREDDNPFNRNRSVFEIKDIKNGWVNYKNLSLKYLGQDDSMKIGSFIYCYEELK